MALIRRSVAWLLALALCFGLCPPVHTHGAHWHEDANEHITEDDRILLDAPNAFSGGSGTASNPYLVATAQDFLQVASYPSYYFRQVCDISMAGYTVTPIYSFSGTYDGGGFAIEDIVYSGTLQGIFVQNSGTIKNLSFRNCDLTMSSSYAQDYIGGIVGENYGTISDCSFSGNLTVDISSRTYYYRYSGGIVGRNRGTVVNCVNTGHILIKTGRMSTAAPAGIAGYNLGTIRNCLNDGLIETENAGNTACGGIAGYNQGTIRSVKNTGTIRGSSCWHDDYYPSTSAYVGGIVGQNKGTVSYAQNYGTIEATGTLDGDHAYAGGIAGYNGGAYNDPGPYVVEYSKNYGQILAHSTGGEARVGGIAGTVYKNAYARYCCNEGYLNASDSGHYSSSLAGGITGVIQYGTVTQCCNHGEVRCNTRGYDSLEACGIAPATTAVITDCYNDGDVYSDYTGSSRYARVAGLFIDTDTTCQNSFNLGSLSTVSSGNRKYGLYSHDGAWDKNILIGCYTTNLYSNKNTSCLITDEQAKQQATFAGYDFDRIWAIDPKVNNGYPYLRSIPAEDDLNWYIDPALIVPVTGVTLDKTSLTLDLGDTAALKATVHPENALDKRILWYSGNSRVASVSADGTVTANGPGSAYIYAETNDGCYIAYCYVSVRDMDPVFSGGTGTQSNPYLIATAEDLQNITYRRDAYYRQIANISLAGRQWRPIGSQSNPFSGSFDGNGFLIEDLTVNTEDVTWTGLFGYSTGTLKNIRLLNATVTAVTDVGPLYCGAVVGYNTGNVTGCTVGAAVTATTLWEEQNACAGGIAGYSSQAITGCAFAGSVSAKVSRLDSIAYSGGITGYGVGATSCRNYGRITSAGAVDCDCYAGGILGCATGDISSCYNSGSIVAEHSRYSFSGGIAGLNAGRITGCKNAGSIYAATAFQGSSDGDPTPPDGALAVLLGGPEALAGGITGSNYSTVSFCENTGAIHATSTASEAYAGGIAGYNNASSTLEDLKNSGSVLADSTAGEARAGGIASSSHHNSMVRRSCNTGSVTITETGLYCSGSAGGVVAVLQYGTVTQCCNHGNVHATATLYEPGAGGILNSLTSEESYNMFGKLLDCYNDGTVSCRATSRTGYLSGITEVSSRGNVIQNCYNVGTLRSDGGSVEIWGLFKIWGGTTYTSTGCYVTAMHRSTGGGTLMTAEESTRQETYSGYDFTSIWGIDPAVNGGRPYLKTLPSDNDSRWYSGIEELIPVTGLTLDRESWSLHIGGEGFLQATVLPTNATDPAVNWVSSDPSVVSVYSDGYVYANAPGTAVITATTLDGGFRASCVITVTGHSYVPQVQAPTCTDWGYTLYACEECGISYEDDYTEPLGHFFVGRHCMRCGAEDESFVNPNCGISPEIIYQRMLAMQESFPEGMPWTNDDFYAWYGGIYYGGYGCAAFAFLLSDAAFGTLPSSVIGGPVTIDQIRVGDILRVYGDTHSVIVLEVYDTHIVIAEGNYNSSIHWGRVMTAAEVAADTDYIMTRYPAHREEAVVTGPTCTEGGYTTHICTECGHTRTDSYVDALGHAWDNGVITKEPTETEEGLRLYSCTRCDATRTETIPKKDHVHQYTSVVTPPTCTEQGYTTHTCHCGHSYVDSYTNALGHDFGAWYTVTAPTCTEDGQERQDCSRCDAHNTRTVAATGHSYTSVVTDPTCTEQGYTTHTCHCGHSYVDSYTDALGHDFGAWYTVTAPTCTTDGTERQDCSRCDAHNTRTVTATGHSYTSVVTPPTCTEQGYTTHTCHCGHSYVDSYTDALGHDFGAWYTVTAPTCTEDGQERQDCSRCDAHNTRTVAATGHSYTSVVTPPTCTEQGYTTHTCHCGHSYVDSYTDALGHDFGAWYTVTAPTCTTDGTERQDCSRCDASNTRTVAATGHSYTSVVTDPTCTEGGYTTHTCHCGHSYVDAYTDALGHDFGAWYETKAPTCTTDGTERQDCSRCDAHNTRTVAATGHSYTSVVTDPTCTEGGYTTHTCHCGHSYVDSYTDALGHDFGAWYETKAPTCTTDGTERQDCSRCDAHNTRTVTATGHSYTSVVTDPTCTEQGYTTHTCHCGHSYVDSYTDALGHSFTNYVSDGNATMEADGTKTALCDRGCGATHTVPDEGSRLEPTQLTSERYTIQDGYLYRISIRTTVAEVREAIGQQNIRFLKDGNLLEDTDRVGTGTVLQLLAYGEVVDQVTLIIAGDTNGDGDITLTDMLQVKSHILRKTTLTGAAALAADTNRDGAISLTDYLQLKAHILGKQTVKGD